MSGATQFSRVEDADGNLSQQALVVKNPDGTYAYPITFGSTDLVALEVLSNEASGTDFASFTATYTGTATVMISLATASVVNLWATPSGGTAASLGAINSGTAIPASEPFSFDFPISNGAAYAFQLATAQSGDMFVSVKGVNA